MLMVPVGGLTASLTVPEPPEGGAGKDTTTGTAPQNRTMEGALFATLLGTVSILINDALVLS